MANGQTVSNATSNVVVVAADADRLGQYEDALRKVQVPTRGTVDADEAESFLTGLSPDVLVLDRGLPRLTLFRLYGLVREDPNEPPVQVVFVGQEGETGPGDHYLPGDPSPSNVAARVTELLASAAPSSAPPEPVRPAASPSTAGAATAASAAAAGAAAAGSAAAAAGSAPTTAARAPEAATTEAQPATPVTNGVNGDAVAAESAAAAAEEEDEAPAEAPARAGRRLDVILIRVGLVLLILGALLILIQSDAFPRP